MAAVLWFCLCGLAHAYLVRTPPSVHPVGASVVDAAARNRALSPAMVLNALKEQAAGLKEQAAEAIIAQKVTAKMEAAQQKYDIPDRYIDVLSDFFVGYMIEIYKVNGQGEELDEAEQMLSTLLKQVLLLAKEPHQFEPFHTAMREPFDYYALGCKFAAGLVDADGSRVYGKDRLEQMAEQLARGENVVLLANHQSEADPQIFSALLDRAYPGFAERTIFVAGDRVTTDMLAMFSMGRNLLCIFSKKHVDNPPEQKATKQKHNRMVMKKMGQLFKEGGKCIWVAPSGGRDRPDAAGNYQVAPFDAKSVEMFRLMADKSGVPVHFYPLSMLTWPNCPPPSAVGGDVGEKRIVKYAPAGLHFADEIPLENFAEGCLVENFPEGCSADSSREELRDALAAYAQKTVATNYQALEAELL